MRAGGYFLMLLLGLCWGAEPATAGERSLVEVLLASRRVEGTPLFWNSNEVALLGRDGHLWSFAPSDVRQFQKRADAFRSLPISELRATLLRELGDGYEVSATRHYVVAHAKGQRDLWAQRFEDLYRSLVHYFSVRGFKVPEPEFPLIGVVCRSRDEFVKQSKEHGNPVVSGVLGYYSPQTNRIMLYDAGKSGSDWRQNAAVVIHEATHQTAFNTGIHNRFRQPPVWVAEGLATLFEAPGVYDSQKNLKLTDRFNLGRLRDFRSQVLAGHRPETITDVIAKDDWFERAPQAAYAEAWALTFYLVENLPRQYADYLARTARRKSFTAYSASDRLADFDAVFGADRVRLEAQFVRYMKGLPSL